MTARGARGFTLIEVLVALAVLAIALSAIIKTMSTNTLNSIYLRDRTLAQWVALNKITELQLGKDWPSPGKSDGSTIMGNHEWFWEAEIKTTPYSELNSITLRVRDQHDAENPVSTLHAYIGRIR